MSHLTSHLVRCAGSFPCRSGPRHIPTGILHGLQFPLVHIHCCTTCSSIATPCRNMLHLVPISCRVIASQWAAEELFHARSTSCPPSALAVSAGLFVLHFLFLSTSYPCTADFLFLKSPIPESHSVLLMAQLWSALSPCWSWSWLLIEHGAVAGLCSQRPPLQSHSYAKPCHLSQIHWQNSQSGNLVNGNENLCVVQLVVSYFLWYLVLMLLLYDWELFPSQV